MARATRIYIVTDKTGFVLAARTVKYEMKAYLKERKENGLNNENDLLFWSMPDGNKFRPMKVDYDFFFS